MLRKDFKGSQPSVSDAMTDQFISYLSLLNIPAVELQFQGTSEDPYVYNYNQPFSRVFTDGDGTDRQLLSDVIMADGGVHSNLNTAHSNIKNSELLTDFIQHNGRTYLRHRGWPDDTRVVDMYVDATGSFPHQEQLEVFHRIFRHNLRNGLNTILGWVEMITRKTDNEDIQDAAERVITTTNELSRVSSEAGTLQSVINTETTLRRIEITNIIEESVSNCMAHFDSPDINVELDSETYVYGSGSIELAFENIIDNAIRHNNDVSVHITADEKPDLGVVDIYISDTGTGIPEIEREVVLGNAGINNLSHGSGIGLWIVKWVIDMHYGSLNIPQSNADGTTFQITLPVKDD